MKNKGASSIDILNMYSGDSDNSCQKKAMGGKISPPKLMSPLDKRMTQNKIMNSVGKPSRARKFSEGGSVDKWMQDVHPKKGALHKQLNIPEDKKIPTKTLEKAAHSSKPLLEKRANLALRYRGKKNGGEIKKYEVGGQILGNLGKANEAEDAYYNSLASHDPNERYTDIDKSSLAGSANRYYDNYNGKDPNAATNFGKQYQSDYTKFVGADNSKSQGILNQPQTVAPGQSNGIDYNAMRARLQAKGQGQTLAPVDRRSDAYKAEMATRGNAYRDQSMAETQAAKRRSGAFHQEMHDQRNAYNANNAFNEMAKHGYQQDANGNFKRSMWDTMKDENPGLMKAMSFVPGVNQAGKAMVDAVEKKDPMGMAQAGMQAFNAGKGTADTANGYLDKGQGYLNKAKGMMGRKAGGEIKKPEKRVISKRFHRRSQ